jgi:membrane protein
MRSNRLKRKAFPRIANAPPFDTLNHFATDLGILTSMLFSWYVASFESYNRLYGSLGAGIGFMVWIWLSVVVILIGAELNAEMEHQTARDTTAGGEKPLGMRGAVVAGRVGPAQS